MIEEVKDVSSDSLAIPNPKECHRTKRPEMRSAAFSCRPRDGQSAMLEADGTLFYPGHHRKRRINHIKGLHYQHHRRRTAGCLD